MTTTKKSEWTVVDAYGNVNTVEADRADLDDSTNRVTFYDGDEVVASFVGASSWHKTKA